MHPQPTRGGAPRLREGAAALTLLTATGAHAEGRGDIRVTGAVVNGGKDVTIGTTRRVTYPIAITVRDNSGVRGPTHVKRLRQGRRLGLRRLDRHHVRRGRA